MILVYKKIYDSLINIQRSDLIYNSFNDHSILYWAYDMHREIENSIDPWLQYLPINDKHKNY